MMVASLAVRRKPKQFNFKYDSKAKETDFNAMTFAFGMVHEDKHFIFHR